MEFKKTYRFSNGYSIVKDKLYNGYQYEIIFMVIDKNGKWEVSFNTFDKAKEYVMKKGH